MVDQAQVSLHGSKVLLNEQVDWHSSNGNTSPVRLLSTCWFLTEWEITDKHRKKATVMTYLDNRWELDNSMNSYLASYRHRWLNIEISIEMSVCTECALLSRVRLFVTPWTVACQAPLSIQFSRQEYWSRLPFPPPGDLPDPGIELMSPALADRFFTPEPPGKYTQNSICTSFCSVSSEELEAMIPQQQ